MGERTFDLTVTAPRNVQIILGIVGVAQIVGGILFMSRGHGLSSGLYLVLGVVILSWCFFSRQLNKHIIAFHDDGLEISRGIFRHRRIDWASISEIQIGSTSVEIQVKQGKREKITFGEMSFGANQTVRHRMISEFSPFVDAEGVSVRDSQAL